MQFELHFHYISPAAEYAAPVWRNSSHVKLGDHSVNKAARIITRYLKLDPFARTAAPPVRHRIAAKIQR